MSKLTNEERAARCQEALERATNPSIRNAMIVEIAARAAGITDAIPGENVLTFNAWIAKGRAVRKGEKALCKLAVFFTRKDKDSDETVKRMTTAAVFHISQTDPIQPRH
jgi:hypothetical protein